jgi:hypothetical protein
VTDTPPPFDDVVRIYHSTHSIIVWAGKSDKAIFDTQSNWLFRAWHDWAHIRSGHGFTVAQEQLVARFQQAEISSDRFASLVWVEVAEQALYLGRTGKFVEDQVDFFLHQGVVSP